MAHVKLESPLTWIFISLVVSVALTIIINLALASVSFCTFNGERVPCFGFASGASVFLPIFFLLTIIFLGMFLFVFWILMIIDCIKRDFNTEEEKLLWVLILVLTHVVGAIIYYIAVVAQHKKRTRKRKKIRR